jgi:hypothetical protein
LKQARLQARFFWPVAWRLCVFPRALPATARHIAHKIVKISISLFNFKEL